MSSPVRMDDNELKCDTINKAQNLNNENVELGKTVKEEISSIDEFNTRMQSKVDALDQSNRQLFFESNKKMNEYDELVSEIQQLEESMKFELLKRKGLEQRQENGDSIYRQMINYRHYLCTKMFQSREEVSTLIAEHMLRRKHITKSIEQVTKDYKMKEADCQQLVNDSVSLVHKIEFDRNKNNVRKNTIDEYISHSKDLVQGVLREVQKDSENMKKKKPNIAKKNISCSKGLDDITRLEEEINQQTRINNDEASKLQNQVDDETTKIARCREVVEKNINEKLQVLSFREQNEEKLNKLIRIETDDLEKINKQTMEYDTIAEVAVTVLQENAKLTEKCSKFDGNDIRNIELKHSEEGLKNMINEKTLEIAEIESNLLGLEESNSVMSSGFEDLVNKNVEESEVLHRLEVEYENNVSLSHEQERHHINLLETINDEMTVILSEKEKYEAELKNKIVEEKTLAILIEKEAETIKDCMANIAEADEMTDELSIKIKSLNASFLDTKNCHEIIRNDLLKKIGKLENETQLIEPTASNLQDYEIELDVQQTKKECKQNEFMEKKQSNMNALENKMKKMDEEKKNFEQHYESANDILNKKSAQIKETIAKRKVKVAEILSKTNEVSIEIENLNNRKPRLEDRIIMYENRLKKIRASASLKMKSS